MEKVVSIVMPAYNCADYIADSIRSVQEQTYPHWELWIIDDISTDNTADVVAPFLSDPRIHYEVLEQKGGAAAARSRAMALATGDYVAFLDSDDLWLPEKLEKQLAFMNRLNEAGTPCYFSCTAYSQIDENGNKLGLSVIPHKRVNYRQTLFLSSPIGNSTALYDRTHFGDVTVPPIQKRNDFALWLRLLRGGDYCYGMEDSLMLYRVRGNSLSANKLALIQYHWQLYRHIEKLPLITCVAAVCSWAFVKGTGIGIKRRRDPKE